MSMDREPKRGSRDLRRRVEHLAYEALRRAGDLVPTTPEEVARLEKAVADDVEPVPPTLLSPPDISDPASPPAPRSVVRPVDEDTQRHLARAAREGRTIPADVEERMRRDREAAERHGKK